jgi:UDP-2,4-diacetamido-2,4,6-trideoxy-beta-L-altropyranose hydrolase
MKILLRCDAGRIRGSGHLMRCLTLAEALANQGHESVFVCREEAGEFLKLVRQKNFPLHTLPASGGKIITEEIWSDKRQQEDFLLTRRAVSGQNFDWVVADHYALGSAWETSCQSIAKKIMVIDDLANRPHDCDLLLDQNEYTDKDFRYQDLIAPGVKALLGAGYTLLRQEFSEARAAIRPMARQVKNVLILIGGGDYRGLTLRIIDAMMDRTDLHIDVVTGRENSDRAAIEQHTAHDPRFTIYPSHPKISDLMLKADIAFGAGGTATWEFCCLGVSALLISSADNQIRIGQDADRLGFARYIGHFDSVSGDDIKKAFAALADDVDLRQSLRAKACSLVDGNGSKRVCAVMTELCQ